MKVSDPSGVEWTVSRHRPQWRRWNPFRPTEADPAFTRTDLAVEWAFLLALLVLVLAPDITIPAFLVGLAVWIAALVAERTLRHPWVVEARSDRGELAWRVRGARRSRRAVAEVAAALEHGDRSVVPDGGERLLPGSYSVVRVVGRGR